MARVIVTGGAGLLGGYVIDALRGAHAVTSLDLRPPVAPVGHVEADIRDLPVLERAFAGADAVMHVAAAANIHSGPHERIVEINALGTWTVLEAAARAGVRRVVLCSSDSVLGNTVWKDHFFLPDALPVDETHSLRPTDPYGLSKLMAEEAGRSFAARGALEVLALRPVFVLFPSMMGEVRARHADPETYVGPSAGGHVGAGGGLCWHHIDPRDVARAFALALDAPYRGFESFYLAAASTLRREPTLDVIRARFGALPDRIDLGWFEDRPHAPMFDTRRAAERLGWRPQHDHRGAVFGPGRA